MSQIRGGSVFSKVKVDAEVNRSLVRRLRAGNTRAFEELYDGFRERTYAFLLRLAQRREVADDLFQLTWLKISQHANSVREDTDLASWIFTIARNEFRSHRRWSILDLSRLAVLADRDEWPAPEMSPHSRAESTEALAALDRALRKISAAHREALLLVAVEGFDPEKAAEMLGISHANLRKRVSRARAEVESEYTRLTSEQSGGQHVKRPA